MIIQETEEIEQAKHDVISIIIPSRNGHLTTDITSCPYLCEFIVTTVDGLGYARNSAVQLTHGSLIVMLDSDLKINPELWSFLYNLKPGHVAMAKVNGHYSTRVFACHRSDFLKVGGFDEGIRYVFEDGDFMHRAYQLGMKYEWVPSSLYEHVDHPARSEARSLFVYFDWEYARLFLRHKHFMHPRLWQFFTSQTSFKRRKLGVRHFTVKVAGFLYWNFYNLIQSVGMK